jgi:predicted nucleic acid-binding protein
MPLVLMDTNILVYTYDPADLNRQEKALTVLTALEEQGSGCLSVQSLSEFVNVAVGKKRLSIAEAILQVEQWSYAFPVFNLTPQIVIEAARGVRDHQLSYYDAQIWAAARLNQVPVVFSEDFQNGQILEGVRFVNPFDDLFNLDDWS